MRTHRLTTAAGTVLSATMLFAAPAGAQRQDLRSPDARDAAALATAKQDLRSPDAQDAAALATAKQDLRSADARDAAARVTSGAGTVTLPQPVVVHVAPRPDAGFEWDSAAIGAIAGAGLIISIAGGGVLITRRRPRAARPA